MAGPYNEIPLNPGNVEAAMVLAYLSQVRALRAQAIAVQRSGAVVLQKLAAMVNGSDYTDLELQLGGLAAGQGLALFNQINSGVGNFADGTQTQNAANSALDQMCAFIG